MFDEIDVDIPCPNCNNNLETTVRKLKTNPIMHCKYCGDDIQINTDTSKFDREALKIEKSINNLRKHLKNSANRTL